MRTVLIAPAAILLLSLPLWFAESRAAAGAVLHHMVESYFVMFLNTLGAQFGCFI